MIAVIAAIIGMTVIGLPITMAIDPRARGGSLVGLSFLYGSGAVYVTVLLLPWNLPLIVSALIAVAVVARVIPSRSEGSGRGLPMNNFTSPWRLAMTRIADALTALTLAGYALFATLAKPWEWDFWAIWGLKARVFFEHGGIDWRFLASRWNEFAHPDYPLLVPMNFDFLALVAGGWNDRWFGILFVAYAVALVLIVRDLAAREVPPPFAAIITLAIAGLACTRYVGMAEGALVAFGTAAILLLRNQQVIHAALLLGLAASTKQEGVTLLIAVVIALIVSGRARDAVRLWPAVVIAAPWWIVAAIHGLGSDLLAHGMFHRAAARLSDFDEFTLFLYGSTPDRLLWLLILISLIVVNRRRDAPYLLILILQLAAFMLAYVTTPYDLRWHVVTSWPRLARQLAPATAFITLVLLAKTFLREEDLAHAEARSDL